jgi:hypothetical protein
VDFLIWDLADEVLLVFKITLCNINDDENNNTNYFNKDDWVNLGIDESKIYFIWIAFDNFIEKVTKMMPNNLHVSFSSISNQFPIFKVIDYN